MNQLASESVLFENTIADSNDLALLYRSYWSGVHAMCGNGRPECSLARLVERAGFHATLLTDDESVLQHPLAADFGQLVSLTQPGPDRIATAIEETRFAQLTLAAIERLVDSQEPGLLWIHAQAMNGPWDAPRELAEPFRDEEDPEPYAEIVPPQFVLERDHDPDDVLQVLHAYAAQVSVIDTCIGSLLDAIENHPLADETIVILTSPRGYPIGEHGRVGAGQRDLFGETLNVPLLIRQPNQQTECSRLNSLAQPSDLYATLAGWFGLDAEATSATGHDLLELTSDELAWSREAAFSCGDDQRTVRTPAWFLHTQGDASRSLFAKPDDRWEANEVADRCGEVPNLLAAVICEFEELINQKELAELPPLAPSLVERLE